MAMIEKGKAVRVIAHMSDFEVKGLALENGDVPDRTLAWKWAFYELWRHQMTWSFAYTIEVKESRNSGVYVDLLINPSFKDPLLDTMDSLGYGDIKTTDEVIGLVDGYSLDDDVDDVVIDW